MKPVLQATARCESQEAIRVKCVRATSTFVGFKEEETEQSIAERFEQIVASHPDRVAVETRNCTLRYEALNKAANRIARAILAICKTSEQPIALFLDHGAPMIAALLGVLKAGKIYVPVDPSFPVSRTTHIVEDSQAGLMVTSNKNLSIAKELTKDSLQLLNIDEIESGLSTDDLGLPISPDSIAYILYTSGSTGTPKGVVQNHRNVLHEIMEYTNTLFISTADRMTLLYSYSVNGAVRGIFGALLNGAALYPLDVKKEGLAALANLLIEKHITFYHSVPTVFRNCVATLTGEDKFPNLRLIRFGGERVLARDVELFKTYFSDDCVLYAGMGATETGHVCEYFIDKHTPITGSVVPTGYPVEGKEVLLLGEDGREVGSDRVGEIAVRSRYLSPGYWRRPELTQAVFLPNPADGCPRTYRTGDLGRRLPDGCIEHLGRTDFQAKSRGYRIELAETEMALLEFPGIKEAVVMAREDHPGDQQLVGYFVSSSQSPQEIGELRRFLKDRLPDYLVPSAFVSLDTLPLTPNGKLVSCV